MKTALVCGAGGFIGNHLVSRLKSEGYWVRGVDFKYPEFSESNADDFIIGDLRDWSFCLKALSLDSLDVSFDEVYQLAADMGGADFISTGKHDADILNNSMQINLNILSLHERFKKIFYSSSACVYPEHNQTDPQNPVCSEGSVYPAKPDSEYGWEKLFSERLYLAYQRNYGVDVRIARLHNVFGVEGTYKGGREKAPAAICRKVAKCQDGGEIEIYGDGKQTRSFLYIDDCIEGIIRLMNSEFNGPVNIGSEVMLTIKTLAEMIIAISGKKITVKNVDGPTGVKGRNSDNQLIRNKLNWEPQDNLLAGLIKTYRWIMAGNAYSIHHYSKTQTGRWYRK